MADQAFGGGQQQLQPLLALLNALGPNPDLINLTAGGRTDPAAMLGQTVRMVQAPDPASLQQIQALAQQAPSRRIPAVLPFSRTPAGEQYLNLQQILPQLLRRHR